MIPASGSVWRLRRPDPSEPGDAHPVTVTSLVDRPHATLPGSSHQRVCVEWRCHPCPAGHDHRGSCPLEAWLEQYAPAGPCI